MSRFSHDLITLRILGGDLKHVESMSGGCGEAVSRVWKGCLKGLGRLEQWCLEHVAVWNVQVGCLECVRRLCGWWRKLMKGVGRLYGGCGEVFFKCVGYEAF